MPILLSSDSGSQLGEGTAFAPPTPRPAIHVWRLGGGGLRGANTLQGTPAPSAHTPLSAHTASSAHTPLSAHTHLSARAQAPVHTHPSVHTQPPVHTALSAHTAPTRIRPSTRSLALDESTLLPLPINACSFPFLQLLFYNRGHKIS